MSAAKKSSDLPSKEAALLKQVLKFHENKQYKKGLKTCDQILKKVSDHGETTAMKALFLSNLSRKDEAHELIKKALRLDLSSSVSWHVYGLIHRNDKNYEEAVKCYARAIQFDKQNLQLHRDHAMLQAQVRNYDALIDGSISLIVVRPQVRAYWLGLAAAFYAVKNYEATLETLQHFYDMFQSHSYVEQGVAYENSEVYLFKSKVLEESGDLQGALDCLIKNESSIVDKRGMNEAKARLYDALGHVKSAEIAYKGLVNQNPDCHEYLQGLLKCKGLAGGKLTDAQTKELFELLEDLLDLHPRSNAIRRVPLTHASGKQFKVRVNAYVRPMLRKGVPSLYVSLRSLYTDPEKQQVIEEMMLSFEKHLKSESRFEPVPAGEEEGEVEVESPAVLLWALYYLALHFDGLGQGEKALKYIDEAIEHTPTLVELLMTKARILKHLGDLDGAMQVMDQARKRDLQDRFINSKCTKYMLRNDAIESAESTVTLFCRPDSQDKLGDLIDMQCSWFTTELGSAYLRTNKPFKALKKFHQVEKFYADMADDEFDFHNYSLRKGTLRAYVDLLKVTDSERKHPLWTKAALEAVRIYIGLLDKEGDEERERVATGVDEMSESEKRKAMRKAKKAELTGGAAAPSSGNAGNNNNNNNTNSNNTNNPNKKVDVDPEGLSYSQPATWVPNCLKFLKPLCELNGGSAEVWALAAHVHLRRKSYLQALRCLKKGLALDKSHPELHTAVVRFIYEVSTTTPSTNATAVKLLREGSLSLAKGITYNPTSQDHPAVSEEDLPSSADLARKYNETFATKHLEEFKCQVAAAEASTFIAAREKVRVRETGYEETRQRVVRSRVFDCLHLLVQSQSKGGGVKLNELIYCHKALLSVSRLGSGESSTKGSEERKEFIELSIKMFPQSSYFGGEQVNKMNKMK